MAFVPAYPRGLGFGSVVGGRTPEGRRTWQAYWANAVDVPGPATELLGGAAREANAYLAIGVIERDGDCEDGIRHGRRSDLLGELRPPRRLSVDRQREAHAPGDASDGGTQT